MVKYVEIQSNDNILRGFLTTPQMPKGLVIMFHGFTGHKNENGFMFKQLAKDFQKNDFASLRVDFMGSGDSDGSFEDMTFDTEVSDAKAIITYVLGLNLSNNIYILGFSMGGAVATQVVNEFQDKIAGLILIAPAGNMSHVERFYQHPNWYDDSHIDMGGYLLSKQFILSLDGKDLYEGVKRFAKPVLIIHGSDDKAVPVTYGEKYSTLYQNSKLIKIEGANHCFTTMKDRSLLSDEILSFIKEVKTHEDSRMY